MPLLVCRQHYFAHPDKRWATHTPQPQPLCSCTSDTSYYENIVEAKAKQMGHDPAAYPVRQFIIPTWQDCNVAARAVIGGHTATFLGWQGYTYPGAITHESGHSLGLHHARWTGAGLSDLLNEYADFSSAMSNVGVTGICYNLPQQAFLGWNTPQVVTPAKLPLASTRTFNMSNALASRNGARRHGWVGWATAGLWRRFRAPRRARGTRWHSLRTRSHAHAHPRLMTAQVASKST